MANKARDIEGYDKLIDMVAERLKELKAEREALMKMRNVVATVTSKQQEKDDGAVAS